MGTKKPVLILDANVLIDLLTSDRMILPLISRYVGQVEVPTTIFDEVDGFTANDCIELGIKMIEPTLYQVLSAASYPKPLSFYDWVCFLLAKDSERLCVTNDKALRSQCKKNNVDVMWELEMLCLLFEAGGLSREQCKAIILSIQQANPYYITKGIVDRAFKRIGV